MAAVADAGDRAGVRERLARAGVVMEPESPEHVPTREQALRGHPRCGRGGERRAGGGPRTPLTLRDADTGALVRASFADEVDHAELRELLLDSDVFVVTSVPSWADIAPAGGSNFAHDASVRSVD